MGLWNRRCQVAAAADPNPAVDRTAVDRVAGAADPNPAAARAVVGRAAAGRAVVGRAAAASVGVAIPAGDRSSSLLRCVFYRRTHLNAGREHAHGQRGCRFYVRRRPRVV